MCTTSPPDHKNLSHLGRRLLLESPTGVDVELPRAGSSLENAYVYDAVARELIQQAKAGRVQVVRSVTEHGPEGAVILEFVFRRLA